MPCQTHEWAFGASIRSFFLNPLGEKQDPSPFYFFICILPSAGTSDTGKTLPDPRVGIWCQLKAFRIFIIFVFFFYFLFFYDFYVSITPPSPPGLRLPSENPYLRPSTDNRDTGKTLPDPQVGIGASVRK